MVLIIRAKISVWWPGISSEIENKVKQYHTCAKQFSQRKEPIHDSDGTSEYPWQKVGADLCYIDKTKYLVVTDYFSRYPKVQKLKKYYFHSNSSVAQVYIFLIWNSRSS